MPSSNARVAETTSDMAYAYDTFTTGLILDDMYYKKADPGPGDAFPSFDLELVGGGHFTSRALGNRPVLIIFGSRTCPVTASARGHLQRLHARYGNAVRFVIVNTREAHPGEKIPQPKTYSEKLVRAAQLGKFMGEQFEVAVDSIDGALHRAVGPKPNSAYLLSPDGTILYRSHWANDEAGLARAISAVVADRPIKRGRSSAMFGPLLRAIGHLPGIIRDGGSKVERDVWRAVPPFAILAHLSRLFAFLPTDLRGAMAMALVLGIVGAGALALLV